MAVFGCGWKMMGSCVFCAKVDGCDGGRSTTRHSKATDHRQIDKNKCACPKDRAEEDIDMYGERKMEG